MYQPTKKRSTAIPTKAALEEEESSEEEDDSSIDKPKNKVTKQVDGGTIDDDSDEDSADSDNDN